MVNEDSRSKPEGTRLEPLTGAYYWVPMPSPEGVAWSLTTCHDLEVWDGISHREFWPHILEILADIWNKDAETLKRRLRNRHTGLPRGRVVHPKPGHVILHDNAAPVVGWVDQVKSKFQLPEVQAISEYDEFEKLSRDGFQKVREVLGVSLSLDPAP